MLFVRRVGQSDYRTPVIVVASDCLFEVGPSTQSLGTRSHRRDLLGFARGSVFLVVLFWFGFLFNPIFLFWLF